MTTANHNPYEPPIPQPPTPAERLRHPHQLARFYLIAILSLAISGLCGLILYLVASSPFRELSTTGHVFQLALAGFFILGILSAIGLVLTRTWGWYVALSLYMSILLVFVVLLIATIVSTIRGGYPFSFVMPVTGIILILIPVSMLLDQVTRQIMNVHWPRFLAVVRTDKRRSSP